MTDPVDREPVHPGAPPLTLLLTLEEAAWALRVGRSKVYDLMRSGLLRSVKIGGSRRVPATALNRVCGAAGTECGMTARKRTGRRGNGEGSIYQLPDGRWRGSIFLGYRDGKPHRKYVTRRTRTAGATDLRRLLEAHRQGQLVTTATMTVGEWLATYLEQVARPKVRPRTLDRYRSDIDHHIVPAIGRHRLYMLRPAHLVALYNAKAAEGLSGASLRHMHAVIRRALNVAVRWQLLAVNPATLVDAPRAAQHEITSRRRRMLRSSRGRWS